ncbi:MAG: hypothetical protein ACYDAD_11175 [Acidimicrobiales bacterium]
MGRATVRAAIAAFFAPPAVPVLNTVYNAQPKLVNGQDFYAGTTGANSGAVGWPFLTSQEEERIAVGGVKEVIHDARLVVVFRSERGTAQAAMTDYDALVDACVARLRSDHTLGSQVFQSGEGTTLFGKDIVIHHHHPLTTRNGQVIGAFAVNFVVIEMLPNTP